MPWGRSAQTFAAALGLLRGELGSLRARLGVVPTALRLIAQPGHGLMKVDDG